MNIYKTGEEVFKKALLFSRRRQLGLLLQREQTQIKMPEPRAASSCCCVPVVGHAAGTVRYFSQEHFSEPVVQSLDLEKPSVPQALPGHPNPKNKNLFFQQLDECASPSDVLDFISDKMDTQWRVSNSLTRIWESTKKMTDDQRHYELELMFQHQGFEELCQRVITESPKMQTDDMAYSLLALVRLDVPQRSRVVQTLLRVIQENLNHFDERSISILCGVLPKMEPLPNVEALKEGLRLKLECNISLIQNILPLQRIMHTVGKDSSDELKRQLEKKALTMAKNFTLVNAQYMLTSMATTGHNSKPLMEICCRKIKENVQGIPFSKLLMILRACQDLHYRNSALLSSIAEHVVTSSAMWTNKQIILLLLEFEKMYFYHPNLMDVFAERVIQNPSALLLKDVHSILKIYSLLNHDLGHQRQQFLDAITHAVEAYLDRLRPSILLNVVYSLCLLEHFPVLVVERLLQKDTLDQLFSHNTGKQLIKGLEQKLHALDVCLRLDQNTLPRPLSLPSVLGDIRPPPHQPPPPQLLSMLKSMEGVDIVEEQLVVDKIYHIDFVVTLSPKNNPLQDQPFPQRLAVICAPPSAYCFASAHLRGKLAMQIRHLRILGYSPVLVPMFELDSLPEEKRPEMLRKLVFQERGEPGSENTATVSPGEG